MRDGPGRARVAAESGLILLTALPAGRRPGVADRLRGRYPVPLPADDGLDPVAAAGWSCRPALNRRGRARGRPPAAARRPAPLTELGSPSGPESGAPALEAWRAGTSAALPNPRGPAWDP